MASNLPLLSVSFISTVFTKPVFMELQAAVSPAASSPAEERGHAMVPDGILQTPCPLKAKGIDRGSRADASPLVRA